MAVAGAGGVATGAVGVATGAVGVASSVTPTADMSRSARSDHEPYDSRPMFFSIISSASRTGTSRAIPSVRQSAVIFSESDIGAGDWVPNKPREGGRATVWKSLEGSRSG